MLQSGMRPISFISLLKKAQCVVLVPGMKKGALVFGVKYGRGFVTCRAPSGGFGWSAPGAVRIEGGSAGLQIGISSILLTYGVKHITALQTLLIAVLEPIFNPIWVFLVLGERPGPRALVGGAVILAAVTVRSVVSLRSAVRPAASG